MIDKSRHIKNNNSYFYAQGSSIYYDRFYDVIESYKCNIKYLKDSKDHFPAWIDEIKSAKKFICIEMYIFDDNDFGRLIKNLLLDKLKEGVKVYLIYDWFGCFSSHYKGFFKLLILSGANVVAYNKIHITNIFKTLFRNHRKVLIVDGNSAIVSGLCISSDWEGDIDRNIPPWRDSGIKLEGPIVEEILFAFMDSWEFVNNGNKELEFNFDFKYDSNDNYKSIARVVASKNSESNMMQLDLVAINTAQNRIWITDAYFMPTAIYVQSLIKASKSGVDVRLLVPRTSDIKLIAAVSRIQYRNLLKSGIKIYEWNGSMIHAKTSIVDNNWARLGSTNSNVFSWIMNRELDIIIEDEKTINKLADVFLEDIKNSTQVVLFDRDNIQLRDARKRLSTAERMKISHVYGRSLARQVVFFSNTIDNNALNSENIDKTELFAFIGIGIFIIILILLIYFIPKILVYTFLFILTCILLIILGKIFHLLFKDKGKDN